jgi:transposase
MQSMPVGIDIAKNVFQVHYVDAGTGEIVNKPIKRAAFLEHFANRAPCLIGMEACGGAQHWARGAMPTALVIAPEAAGDRERLASLQGSHLR